MIKILKIFLIVFCLPLISIGEGITSSKLKVFVEGAIVDFNYLRNNISFIDFINDSHESDIHVIITRKGTGSGGMHYYVSFNSKSEDSMEDLELNCIATYQDSRNDVRYKLTETLKSGLLVYSNENQLYYSVNVKENEGEINQNIVSSSLKDPWNSWVFDVGLKGAFDVEERKKNYEYESFLEVNRITDKWRIRNEYNFSREETRIKKSNGVTQIIRAFNKEHELESRIVYSMSPHWSAGVFVEGQQTTYRNIEFNASVNAAIEYNFYPWEMVNRRILTIGYFIGNSYYDYFEPTVFNKDSENLMSHRMRIDFEKIEKWGEIEVNLEAMQYLTNTKYYALEAGIELSWKVAKGLFLDFGFEAEKVNNQLYLPASELSDEELLLNVRKLQTSFELSGDIGIRYRFGSIFNNVVNQRL